MAQDNAAGVGYLVVEELAEVLLIDLALLGIHYCGEAVQNNVLHAKVLNCADNVRKLADAGGLDEDPVRVVLVQHLLKRLTEISHQRAADAAGVHLIDDNACVLQKSSVDAYLAKLVLDEHQLLTVKAVGYELFNKCGLSGSEEAGEYGDLCHYVNFLS